MSVSSHSCCFAVHVRSSDLALFSPIEMYGVDSIHAVCFQQSVAIQSRLDSKPYGACVHVGT